MGVPRTYLTTSLTPLDTHSSMMFTLARAYMHTVRLACFTIATAVRLPLTV